LNKKTLVAYASGFGTTKEIAEEIGKVLSEHGLDVDVRAVDDVKDLSRYHAIVLGASIRGGSLLPQAMDFLSRHHKALSKIPTAVFVVSLTMQKDTEENRRIVASWLHPLREIVKPIREEYFAGRLALKELPFAEPLLRELISQPEADWRDWDKIRAWARNLVPVLSERGDLPTPFPT
jgi:menaquinone-dependent protoporphyrinogen oxidase